VRGQQSQGPHQQGEGCRHTVTALLLLCNQGIPGHLPLVLIATIAHQFNNRCPLTSPRQEASSSFGNLSARRPRVARHRGAQRGVTTACLRATPTARSTRQCWSRISSNWSWCSAGGLIPSKAPCFEGRCCCPARTKCAGLGKPQRSSPSEIGSLESLITCDAPGICEDLLVLPGNGARGFGPRRIERIVVGCVGSSACEVIEATSLVVVLACAMLRWLLGWKARHRLVLRIFRSRLTAVSGAGCGVRCCNNDSCMRLLARLFLHYLNPQPLQIMIPPPPPLNMLRAPWRV